MSLKKHFHLVIIAVLVSIFSLIVIGYEYLSFSVTWAFVLLGSIVMGLIMVAKSWNKELKGAKIIKIRFVVFMITLVQGVLVVEWVSFILLRTVGGLPFAELSSLWYQAFYGSVVSIFALFGALIYADMVLKEENRVLS